MSAEEAIRLIQKLDTDRADALQQFQDAQGYVLELENSLAQTELSLASANKKYTDHMEEFHPVEEPPASAWAGLSGVYMLDQVGSVGMTPGQASNWITSRASQYGNALDLAGVVGLSLRFGRATVSFTEGTFNPGPFERGLELAKSKNKEFTPRVMDGQYVPASVKGLTVNDESRIVPAAKLLNSVYYKGVYEWYKAAFAWAQQNGVRLFHCSGFSSEWAEWAYSPVFQAEPEYNSSAILLVDTICEAADDAGYTGVIEFPWSGRGPLMGPNAPSTQVAKHMLSLNRPMMGQGNGLDEDGVWGATSSTEAVWQQNVWSAVNHTNLRFGAQDIGLGVAPVMNFELVKNMVRTHKAYTTEFYMPRVGQSGFAAAVATMYS